jgi:hypothetical protein
MDDRLKALEVTIVSIGFNEVWIGSLIHVSQRWYLKSTHVLSGQRAPSCINCGRVAEQVSLGEKTADAGIYIS